MKCPNCGNFSKIPTGTPAPESKVPEAGPKKAASPNKPVPSALASSPPPVSKKVGRKDFVNVIGEDGLETFMKLVLENQFSDKPMTRPQLLQTAMRGGLNGELAAALLQYSETSEEAITLLESKHWNRLYMGLGALILGAVLTGGSYVLASPGGTYFVFQGLLAGGVAYSLHAGTKLLGIYYPICKTTWFQGILAAAFVLAVVAYIFYLAVM